MNVTAHRFFKVRLSCHVSPLLDQLKLLQIQSRIEEKVLLFCVFKAHNVLRSRTSLTYCVTMSQLEC